MMIELITTRGPVNAHLTSGPGKYFKAFIRVYSPKAGPDNPLGTNVDVNRKPLSLCPFILSFKTVSLKYDFKHILNDFIHVYSPRAWTDNPLGTNFWCQQKFLITLPIYWLSKKISLKSDFLPFFVCFFHMYIAPGRGWQPIGTKSLTTERHFLCFKIISSKSDFMYILNDFIHVYSPGARAENPLGTIFDVIRKLSSLRPVLQVSNKSL